MLIIKASNTVMLLLFVGLVLYYPMILLLATIAYMAGLLVLLDEKDKKI